MASRFAETVLERNPFAIDMFNFLWRVLNHAQGQIPNHVESYFNDEIGFSVLYIQYIIRDSLRDLLIGIRIRTTEDAIHVTRKLCRERRSNDKSPVVSQVFLECCAIIAEVYLYCSCGIQIPIESSMVFTSWNLVFSHRRVRELLSNGGWEELTAYAINKYHKKINFINYDIEYVDYPCESFIVNQTYDRETDMMAADFQEYFVFDFIKNRELIQVDLRGQYRQSKSAMRIKRVEQRLIAKQKMGTAEAEKILASQSRMAMRSGFRSNNELLQMTNDISPYVTSDEDCNEEASPSVFELCTKMSNVQIAGESKKKRPKRKKKPSHKSTEAEDGSESSSGSSIESVSPEKASVSETLTSSSRPLKVPGRSPETSPTKSETKVTSPKQSQTGKKGKKKE
ncbi:hypothetical protein JTE90_008986 [Oedothorax gibbosus]|uniref:Uncharacterized protein n=1 Tax=Oedothorax gibbosus TaxID=931172 RepID=A0AAV6UKZ0_9ARAC|nr:hypothetical protein JTE90_008986 [Oedothorax gibbosus]